MLGFYGIKLVETAGVEPAVPRGGRFTVFWGYQFSYISKYNRINF